MQRQDAPALTKPTAAPVPLRNLWEHFCISRDDIADDFAVHIC